MMIHADLIKIFGVQFYISSFKNLCTLNLSQTCSKKKSKHFEMLFLERKCSEFHHLEVNIYGNV